ncbi:MAG: hypothetical protein OXQ31_00765 [Spirochaetaceae bacterium]|nr:hypothetical protein [Spirochaetaceae bacterium]
MFDDGVDPQLQMQRLDDAERARLTTLLVDSRNQSGNDRAEVTAELIERARRQPPLSVDERAERLLRFTEKKARRIGETVTLTVRGDGGSSPEFALAMAWSESTDLSEVTFLRDYLDRQGWIDGNSAYQYAVTVEGHRRIADVKKSADATQAFVAMWFDHEMRAAYTNGIEPAIESAGYKPMRIDQKVDAVKIDDEIIAEIRRSRFLVADFTHGKAGARGGVYFEAGFALGLGIPVIYTCREDAIDSIHFDTRQYHHTLWEGPEDLRDKLKKRILALIGEGPEVSTGSQATRAAPG